MEEKSATSVTLPSSGDAHDIHSNLRAAVETAAVLTLTLGLLGLCVLFLLVLWAGYLEGRWTPLFESHFLAIVGIPVAGLQAVALVQFFRGFHGPIEFSAGPVKFTGGTGPVVLWIFAFSVIVWAMRYLW